MSHQVNVSVPYFSNIPEDVITNTWHFLFLVGSPVETDYQALVGDLLAFYLFVYSAVDGGLTWAPWARPDAMSMKVYDLSDPTPRVPVYQEVVDATASTSSSSTLVPETAICLSFQAVAVAGLPQARRRGRIYLGGMGVGVTAGSSSLFPQISSDIREGICTAAHDLKAAADGHGWEWVVRSKVNDDVVAVDNGWVDNAVDTQRRRGQVATARTIFTG